LKTKYKGSKKIQSLINFSFVVPYLLLFLCWMVIPIISGSLISLTKWTFISGKYQLVGLKNYIDAVSDELFLKGIINTLYYTVMTVILGNLLSFFLAYGLTKIRRLRNLYRKIFFVPLLLSVGVVGIMWQWLYNTDFGLLNYYLGFFGIRNINWLGDSRISMPAVSLMAIWGSCGFNMLIYYAGIREIPKELKEAALIDGAVGYRQLWSIILPLIRPKILFCLVISTIGSIQVFEGAYMLTGVGPYFSNYTAIFHIYYQAFRYFRMGYASACAFILALLIFGFTFFLFKILGNHEEYY